MHLLAAQPGGFVDDEGIIDLAQSSADIVILAAADGVLTALADAMDVLQSRYQEGFPSIRLANWMQLLKPAAFDLYEDKVLEQAQVVVVSFLGGKHYWPYGFERLLAWSKARTGRQLILVPGDDTPDSELLEACTVAPEDAWQIWRYLRESGPNNNQHCLAFIAARWFQQECAWQAPTRLPPCLIYQAGQASSLSQWRQRYQDLTQPVCLLVFYRSHVQSGNTAMFDDLIQLLDGYGLATLPVAVNSLKDPESLALINDMIEQTAARIILNCTGFASNRVGSPDLASEPTDFQSAFNHPIPVLQLILSGSTLADWQVQSQGLRSRDIAMQVVLPEMDGRVITRAVSFKQQAFYHASGQIDLVRYVLHQERAHFVAQLAVAYCRLGQKPNSEKRIALILANYPTKDGRIGNGVGLDTPASTIHILQALAAAGYPVADIPATGNQLIEALLGAVTNNPNTLHERGCWQSMSVTDYLGYFAELPAAAQDAVWQRWGPPEDDHKCRIAEAQGEARIMLAGIRLGETFIGIQPARGFNLDLAANYHDPDLIPPHSYLAYYFWLRHVYQVDAIVHVGKHGNLEWLPGKGTALSDACWPDIALGPLPHFYPFIVNDPGEGAQAKRRTQAVIIDHLMPPMTRAETYGELAQLEGLVDEYYQALGMDSRREDWLKEKILVQVKLTHLVDELGVDQEDDASVLAGLDTYLCDIKEAQIRHGLHVLGSLPNSGKLADTLVDLLRLPRGTTPTSQGILHNLVMDLGLEHQGQAFDPMATSTEPWLGAKPERLQALSDRAWRTCADTKERLENLAAALCLRYLVDTLECYLDHSLDSSGTPVESNDTLAADTMVAINALPANLESLQAELPNTCQLLQHANNTLMVALAQSAVNELQHLLLGLRGGFVPPGPSGAPTRGRLDTFPTGRNFFSVDNRAIPSPAAWAIGERSAQAVIERHLQEHGDYPRQLGLSVWGTATMRTGGDDIAQAFALMGVRPIWALGTNRVTDFEVLSCMLLGRPRVDVTLRVSGFFRDAFANVMRLFDAAVQAIVDFEEVGNGNTIQQNVLQRQAELSSQGIALEEAQRQASYRIFGSKPGAYGAGLQGLIDERCWETREDLAEAYLNWGGYAYDGRADDGVQARAAFAHQLAQLEVVVQNQDNREHDILDSDDYYQFQGGMTNAVSQLSGAEPIVYHNDHSNPSVPKVRTLKEELNRVIRSRVLNPKWIAAMQEHGYKGAFEMAATVDYLFAYDATTELIADYQYQQVCDRLLLDPQNQGFLSDNNPHALEEMAERFLEALQRGMWQDKEGYYEKIQNLLLDIDQQQEQADGE